MNKETKILIGLAVATVVVLFGGALLMTKPASTTPADNKKYDEKILIGESPFVKGKEDAPVTIVEFGDFECPACGASFPITQQIEAEYADKIRFVFRHFPLEMHKNAFDAARASEAAAAQGKFWEMHDILYTKQEEWAEDKEPLKKFEDYASSVGLNMDEYKKAMSEKTYDAHIRAGLTDGTAVGVNATPTFFVNGQKVSGLLNVAGWRNLLDKILGSSSK